MTPEQAEKTARTARPQESAGHPGAGGARAAARPRVLESQRARLLAAVADVAAARGLRGASVAEVTKRAGVTRAVFRNHFSSLEDGYLALVDWMIEQIKRLVTTAFREEDAWHDGVLAGLQELLVFLDSEPICARACLLESMTGALPELESRTELLSDIGTFVDRQIRAALPGEKHPPAVIAEATVTSVLGLLRRRTLSGGAPPYVGLLGELAVVVVTPYVGPAVAEEVARRSEARVEELLRGQAGAPVPADVEVPPMLRHASSYRLRACLQYLGDNPHASNQAVAEGIGISHSGQVCVLLARLRDDGLLVKGGDGPGHPNAWRLSPHGAEVLRSL